MNSAQIQREEPVASDMVERAALFALGRSLRAHGYEFTTVTPSTHQRVLAKVHTPSTNLRDVFGWNRAFMPQILPSEIFELAYDAQVLIQEGQRWRSTVRFSTLGRELFLHSGFPTGGRDSVFFGPDSYRFCAFLDQALRPCGHLVDVGCGSGVGGLHASKRTGRTTLSDINERALQFAAINAKLASVPAAVVNSDVLNAIFDPIDAVIANPPYMCDRIGRTYRHGGGICGEGLALRIVKEALQRLAPGGQLVLYTGSAVVDGEDVFQRQVIPLCQDAGVKFEYVEIDPDVFGEELEQPDYARVERIAAVGLVLTKR